MKVTILNDRASSIYYNGDFFDTNKELDLSFNDAFRIGLLSSVRAEYSPVSYNSELFAKHGYYTLVEDVDMTSGFGGVSYNLIKQSPQLQTVLAGRTLGVNDSDILQARNRELRPDSAAVWHEQPKGRWDMSPFARNIAIVPFETTKVPASWVPRINRFDALFVPCVQNIQMFRDSGVTIPIELIHWGIDPELYRPITRPDRDVFTIGTMGALSIRKGTDVLIEAFKEAFPTEQDVKLICKTSNNFWQFDSKDKRIEVQMMAVPLEELMRNFFSRIDLFVFPTRGEGAGIPPLEAAATGVPVIVTNWSGPEDYLSDEMGWGLEYSFAPAQDFTEHIYKEDCGYWAEPSKDHLVQLLRYAYEHQDEVKAKGKTAAEYIQREWLWEKRIKEYHAALAKHL